MSGDVARVFDAMAASYHELEPWYEHLYAVLHDILRRELGAGGGRRALDAGCGTGFQTALLEALDYDAHGADISAGLLGVARGVVPQATLVQASIEALPYDDRSFDAVTCCGSTLSFVDAPDRGLREIGRVLRPGGTLLLECEHRGSLDLLWALASSAVGDPLGYGLSPARAWRQLVGAPREGVWTEYPMTVDGDSTTPLRLRLFTMGELDALLGDAGLTRCRAWGVHAVTNVIPSTILHRPRLPRVVARVYRRLAAIDRALAGTGVARRLANSVVVLARKDGH